MTDRPHTRDDVHHHVDTLIQRHPLKLWREGARCWQWTVVPSLYEQLRSSTGARFAGGTGSPGGASPVISTGVVSLLIWIEDAAFESALDLAGHVTRTTPGDLRAVAANLPNQDLIDWWADTLVDWVREIRLLLRLDPDRPKWVRGIACPDCGQTTASSIRAGQIIRTPALAVDWTGPADDQRHHPDTEWTVSAVSCVVCGRVWRRGPELEGLADAKLEMIS